MKLGKIVLSTLLLAACAVSGFVVGKANVKETSAMTGTDTDPDINVGMNITVTKDPGAAKETTSVVQFTNLESANASGGDYLAIRMKGNNNTISYFDVIPNTVDGNAFQTPINPVISGVKCIPAGPAGEAWDYAGGRTYDLPMQFGYNWDVWFCIPKTQFTRRFFGTGESLNWNINLYCNQMALMNIGLII